MEQPVDVNFRAVRVADEYELVDSPAIAARIAETLAVTANEPHACRLLTPPVYYSLANGIDDDRAINDAMVSAANRLGTRAFGVAEPKFGEMAAAEVERLATLGAAGVVWSGRAQGYFANEHMLSDLIRHAHRHGLVSMLLSAPHSVNETLWRLWSVAALAGGDIPVVIAGGLEGWNSIQQVRDQKGGDNVFYDLSAMSEGYDLDHVVAAVGAERLLLGSGGGDGLSVTLGVVERSTITAADKEAIVSGNASGLFGLTEAAA